MPNLDFLPTQYRQKHVQRKSQPWRIIIGVSFAVLLAAAALSHHFYRRHVEDELAAIMEPCDLAVSQAAKLAEIQAELSSARATAELYTYLCHPWSGMGVTSAVSNCVRGQGWQRYV